MRQRFFSHVSCLKRCQLLLWRWKCLFSLSLECQTIAVVFAGEPLVTAPQKRGSFTMTYSHVGPYVALVQAPGRWEFTSWCSLQTRGSFCAQQAQAPLVLSSTVKWGWIQKGLSGKPQRWLKGWKVSHGPELRELSFFSPGGWFDGDSPACGRGPLAERDPCPELNKMRVRSVGRVL